MKTRHAIYLRIKGFDIEVRTDAIIKYEDRKNYRNTLESKAVFCEDMKLVEITNALISADPDIYYVHFSVYAGGAETIDTLFEKE